MQVKILEFHNNFFNASLKCTEFLNSLNLETKKCLQVILFSVCFKKFLRHINQYSIHFLNSTHREAINIHEGEEWIPSRFEQSCGMKRIDSLFSIGTRVSNCDRIYKGIDRFQV